MAKHLVKCLYCGRTLDANTEPYVKPRSNRYAHKACAELLEDSKSQEEKDKEALENYIKNLFGISCISKKISHQISFFKDKGYTYTGMLKTLQYFFEIKGNTIEKANGGIGIVDYVYEEARAYWCALWMAQQQNIDVNINEYVLPAREVHIEPPQREPMKRYRKLFTFLNEEEDI